MNSTKSSVKSIFFFNTYVTLGRKVGSYEKSAKKIDVRRGYGPSAAADAKEIHMNMHVF